MAKPPPRKQPRQTDVEVIGEDTALARDVYRSFIRASWGLSLTFVAIVFLVVNVLFACVYEITGGIYGAKSFVDLFFFSVQTSGTIGYGVMYPQTVAAHVVVTIETLASVLQVAIVTGLVFAKFSRPTARVQFAHHPVVTQFDGVPTLMFRLGNQHTSRLLEATLRVVAIKTETTKEGVKLYRMHDLPLDRERSPALSRSWTALHRLLPGTPLHGATPESLARDEVDLILTLTGLDEVSAQTLHSQWQYSFEDVRFGMRHADLLSETPDGRLRIDMRKFDELVATEAG